MTVATPSLVAEALEAHGGHERWHRFTRLTAQVVTGGYLWGMKGIELDDTPRTMSAEFRRPWMRCEPFGHPDWRMTYLPERVLIETRAGEVVAEQAHPRATFAAHEWNTPWTPLQLAYFNGYAIWTYYNLPFLLGEPRVQTTNIPSMTGDGLRLRGVRVRFPEHMHTHSPEQRLYFDEAGLLRRHDYQVDVAGRTRAAHFISDYVDVQGLLLPTKRRVFLLNDDDTLQRDRVVVSVDLSGFELA